MFAAIRLQRAATQFSLKKKGGFSVLRRSGLLQPDGQAPTGLDKVLHAPRNQLDELSAYKNSMFKSAYLDRIYFQYFRLFLAYSQVTEVIP
jgi:hypothetical protein